MTPTSTAPIADPEARAKEIVARLGDEDLVGQVLMPYAYGNDANKVSPASVTANRRLGGADTPAELVRKYRLGGLILVSQSADDPTASTNPTSNVESPAQVRKLTDGLQAVKPSGLPLLIGTDQEHGVVTRIRNGVALFPTAMGFGAANNPTLTEQSAVVSGAELAALGVNLDFAPDADVLADAGNVVIGSRAYGSDPKLVSQQVAAAVKGYQRSGVAATLKHFPGHGRTSVDSHTALPVLRQSRAQLEASDFAPFRAGISAGAAAVMSGHLDAQAIDPGVPASLSRKVLVDVLRGKLGFRGVVISDALNMAPVTDRYQPGMAAVKALVAGNDVLLMPPDIAGAYNGLLSGLKSGALTRDRLREAATRVITLKLRLGTARPELSTVDSAAHREMGDRAAAAAITVVRGDCDASLVSGGVRVSGGTEQQRAWLTQALQGYGISNQGTTVHLTGYGDGPADLARADITVSMDTPYLLATAKSPTLLATFGANAASMRALAAVLAGRAKPTGRLPVTVPGLKPPC